MDSLESVANISVNFSYFEITEIAGGTKSEFAAISCSGAQLGQERVLEELVFTGPENPIFSSGIILVSSRSHTVSFTI